MLAPPRYLAIGAVLTAALGLPCAAAAAGVQKVVAELNAQRSANGLPAGLTADSQLTHDCAKHDAYMADNGMLTHDEQRGAPGYTKGGAYAGANAVLTQGAGWSAGDPYDAAPLHLDQLLAPSLQTVGSADANGYSCTTTFPGWTRPAPSVSTVYSDPGDGATVAPSEVATELPFTPGQLVGIAAGTATGPYLIVLAAAPGQSPLDNPAQLSDATLTGPTGAVPLKIVDGTTPLTGGQSGTLAPYISPGGFLIPTVPLAAGATYHAHVVVTFGGAQTSHDWSFTTLAANAASRLTAAGQRLRFSSKSPAPIIVSFTRANGTHAPSVTIAPGHSVKVNLVPGSWRACGTQPAQGQYAAYQQCVALVVTGKPSLSLGPSQLAHGKLRVRLTYSAALAGRSATLTETSLRCTGTRCAPTGGRPATSTLTLRGHFLTLPVPSRGYGITVTLATAAFQDGDAPYTAASASFTYRVR